MTAAPRLIQRLRRSLREAAGIARSLRIYHGSRGRRQRMIELYRQFMRPGDLVFDIGAHVGDRIGVFRALGARVVALEPQPGPARVIRLIHRRDPLVTLIEAACGDHEGSIGLRINSENPTVSTASAAFIGAAAGASGCLGIATLYRGMAIGAMGIVAPISATSPIVPLAVSVVRGDAFDVMFRANVRNMRMLRKWLDKQPRL